MPTPRLFSTSTVLITALIAACQAGDGAPRAENRVAAGDPEARPTCDPDNGGITLPQGFCAVVVADGLVEGRTRLRHIAVEPDGDVYVAAQGQRDAETPSRRGGILALRDTTGDGKADVTEWFGPEGGTGIEIDDEYLYFATNTAVLRYRRGEALVPENAPDTLVHGLPAEHSHTAKSIALSGTDALYVNIGSPTNACQPIGQDRKPGVMGVDPCPQLETQAGVWRFSANETMQDQAAGERWATGIRNAVALAWNPADNTLYSVQHGRDQLDLWPGFDAEDNSEAPAEELQRLNEGANFGWPYCFYHTRSKRRVVAPEYGGDGTESGRCADMDDPLLIFPGHWAPNDLLFYTGDQFPAEYRNGAFIAFHGSWNRAPVQAGYRVAFVPFPAEGSSTEWNTFANGFAGEAAPASSGDAEHRPMGLAQGPDGSLYITDSAGGRIWRVLYTGR
jgi:glucose/arabinose dehydrogenase